MCVGPMGPVFGIAQNYLRIRLSWNFSLLRPCFISKGAWFFAEIVVTFTLTSVVWTYNANQWYSVGLAKGNGKYDLYLMEPRLALIYPIEIRAVDRIGLIGWTTGEVLTMIIFVCVPIS